MTIRVENALDCDLSEATAFFLYLIPRGYRKILPVLRALPQTIRVATYMSSFEGVVPTRMAKVAPEHQPDAKWPVFLFDPLPAEEEACAVAGGGGAAAEGNVAAAFDFKAASVPPLAAGEVEKLATDFDNDGFVVLPDMLPLPYVELAYAEAMANFDECLEQIRSKGLDFGLHTQKGFKEVVIRNKGRYEMPYRCSTSPLFTTDLLMHNAKLEPLLDAILRNRELPERTDESSATVNTTSEATAEARLHEDAAPSGSTSADVGIASASGRDTSGEWRLLGQSVVMSTAGALEQQWHSDGSHVNVNEHLPCHVLNVFMPLVDLTMENGPTELRPGSHYLTRGDGKMNAKLWLIAKCKKTLRSPVSPCLKRGEALIFDYRTLHRGKANISSGPRPVLVLTYAKTFFKDMFNFPKRSLDDFASVVPAEGLRGNGEWWDWYHPRPKGGGDGQGSGVAEAGEAAEGGAAEGGAAASSPQEFSGGAETELPPPPSPRPPTQAP